jgi:DNA replication protein DnaC
MRKIRSVKEFRLMERTQLFDLMTKLKLYGMRAAYDEIMATGIKRQHEPPHIVGDLLQAEVSEKQAHSIKYQIRIAKLPLAKDLERLVRDLAQGDFLAEQRNCVLVGGTGTGKTHLAIAIARSCIRAGKHGRFYSTVDLVNRLEAEARGGRQGRIAEYLTRRDFAVLDELGYLPFAQTGGQLLFHLNNNILRGQRGDIFRSRESSLELYLPWLDAQWTAGQRNGSELWRRLKSQGFRVCLRMVSEWAGRRRRAEKADAEALARAPSARTIARLMTIGRDNLSKSETVTIAAIERGTPSLVEAREIIAAFQAMVRKKSLIDLDPWLERARQSLVASFANGVTKDRDAVAVAITSAWSNGQTEGQIAKLKLVKRQMYGRGKIDLLQARVIGRH